MRRPWHFATMTDPGNPAAGRRFSARNPRRNGASWSTRCSRARRSSGSSARPMMASPSSRLPRAAPTRGRSPARPGAAPWDVLARIEHPDPALANADRVARAQQRRQRAHRWSLPARSAAMASVCRQTSSAGAHARRRPLRRRHCRRHRSAALCARLPRHRRQGRRPQRQAGTARLRFGYDPLSAIAIGGSCRLPGTRRRR